MLTNIPNTRYLLKNVSEYAQWKGWVRGGSHRVDGRSPQINTYTDSRQLNIVLLLDAHVKGFVCRPTYLV